jgi:hypothetical protein
VPMRRLSRISVPFTLHATRFRPLDQSPFRTTLPRGAVRRDARHGSVARASPSERHEPFHQRAF